MARLALSRYQWMSFAMPHILRSTLWLSFFAVILGAWWMMYMMSMDMGLDLLGRPNMMAQKMRMMDPTMSDMAMTRFGPVFAMWAIMMAAMMLPTMVPTFRSYEDLMSSADGTRAGLIGVILGYLVVWVAFAALIAGVQITLLYTGIIDLLGIATSRWITAGLLIAVGLFQFTRAKEICHGVCHSPMMYFLGHWKNGFGGGVRMGLGLGAFCVGCCWGFMVLGFVGGVMSLLWMGAATLFMVLEKLPQIGHVITKPMGVVLIAGGLLVIASPYLIGG
jgi:predicted metal-binding membrane protein